MSDSLLDRMAWCLRNYKNAARQGRVVSTDVEATAIAALHEYDVGRIQDEEDAPAVLARIAAVKRDIHTLSPDED